MNDRYAFDLLGLGVSALFGGGENGRKRAEIFRMARNSYGIAYFNDSPKTASLRIIPLSTIRYSGDVSDIRQMPSRSFRHSSFAGAVVLWRCAFVEHIAPATCLNSEIALSIC